MFVEETYFAVYVCVEGCYGFVFVNRDEHDLKDLKRYKKKSFGWYQNVIATNGECLTE